MTYSDIAKKEKIFLYAVLTFFAFIFCSISLVNHYNFRTYALDLGLFNNALWDYAHFRCNDYTLLQQFCTNPLGDHFALLTILVSPLYWLFGSYTMLIVQIAGILFGGYGVYKYISSRTDVNYLGVWAVIHFFSIWGIYSALGFDYHDNVMGAMFVPWFLHYFDKQKWITALVFFILIIISKENMALWAAFIGFGLMALNFKQKTKFKYASFFSALALMYFLIIIQFVMPALRENGQGEGYAQFIRYPLLGNNFTEALITIITKPLYILKVLFVNHLNEPIADGIKMELHYMVLLSGGFVMLWKPHYIIMLIPIYMQKLLSDDFSRWGINYQYSIEFVPILTIALFTYLISIKKKKWVYLITIGLVLLTFVSAIVKIDSRVSKWYSAVQNKFYSPDHYKREFNVKKLHRTLDIIPENAKVSAQSPLVPHLAFRDYIYQYPDVKDAEYILLLPEDSPYPIIKQEEYDRLKEKYLQSPDWETIYNENHTLIFKRKAHSEK